MGCDGVAPYVNLNFRLRSGQSRDPGAERHWYILDKASIGAVKKRKSFLLAGTET